MRKKQEAYKHVSLEHQERVLDMIRSQIGKPCPTNTEISADLGIKNGVISNAISALVARKILSRTIGNGERTLTITETGQAT